MEVPGWELSWYYHILASYLPCVAQMFTSLWFIPYVCNINCYKQLPHSFKKSNTNLGFYIYLGIVYHNVWGWNLWELVFSIHLPSYEDRIQVFKLGVKCSPLSKPSSQPMLYFIFKLSFLEFVAGRRNSLILFELKPTAYFETIHIKKHFLRNFKGSKLVLLSYLIPIYIDNQAEARVCLFTGIVSACVWN